MLAQIRQTIDEGKASHGFGMLGVGAGLGHPQFTYTIGFSEHHGFELLCIGLSPMYTAVIFNAIHTSLKNGEPLAIGVPDDRWANMPTKFHRLQPGVSYQDYTIQAEQYYGEQVPVVQLVMCDRNGKFPGDTDYDHAYMDMRQPILPYEA